MTTIEEQVQFMVEYTWVLSGRDPSDRLRAALGLPLEGRASPLYGMSPSEGDIVVEVSPEDVSVYDTSETYESGEELSFTARGSFEGRLVGGPRAIFDEDIEENLVGTGYYTHSFTYPERAEEAAQEAGHPSRAEALIDLLS